MKLCNHLEHLSKSSYFVMDEVQNWNARVSFGIQNRPLWHEVLLFVSDYVSKERVLMECLIMRNMALLSCVD